MQTDFSIELLAPAKDLECGYAAINSGADAVYIGAPRFGAREKAANSLSDIAELTEYAHIYWAKVYVTLNTLLYDHEVSGAIRMAQQLSDMGVDALIIQDYALLAGDLPPIPLIASTQMHNHTLERIRFLEEIGFQRAILARELNLDEIKAIRDHTQIELEVFVHGALCVSYSGQCYMSYAIGGRSGNRGQCAQPCRRVYSLLDSQDNVLVRNRHLLSLKDLNRLADIEDLLAVGITSFKIEGRLKDKTYVTNVVSQYRQELDNIIHRHHLKASSSGTVNRDFVPDVDKTFNRGYTSYFIRGRDNLPGSIDTPKMIGEPMGVVEGIRNHTLSVKSSQKFVPGDGVCWFDLNHSLQGTYVNKVDGQKITLNLAKGIEIGMMLYRNHDHTFMTALERSQPTRRIDIDFTLNETTTGYILSTTDCDHNQSLVTLDINKETALKSKQATDTIIKQLNRTGGTPYQSHEVKIETTFVPFIPVAKLNELRRNALKKLTQIRLQNRPMFTPRTIPDKENALYPSQHLDYRHNVLNQNAEHFLRKHGVLTIEPAAESGLDMQGRIVMRSRQCIKRQLGWCVDRFPKTRYKEPLYLVDENGHRYQLEFDCAQCEMNVLY